MSDYHVRTCNRGYVNSPPNIPVPVAFDDSVESDSWAIYDGDEPVTRPKEITLETPTEIRQRLHKVDPVRFPLKAKFQMVEVVPVIEESAPVVKPDPPPKSNRGGRAPLAVQSTPIPSDNNLDVITVEIQFLRHQTAANIIEIGRRLIRAKEMVGHGNWLKYLQERVAFSPTTAKRFMAVAAAYVNRPALVDLEPTKVYLMLEAPEDLREELAEKAPDMTTREFEDTVRKANEAERKANEAEARADAEHQRAEEANQRASQLATKVQELESRPAEVIKEKVEVKVYEPSPEVQQEIETLRRSLIEKDRTIEQNQKDRDRVAKMLNDTNRDLDKLRQQADKNGTLEGEIRQKEQQLKQLTEMQRKLGANFDDEGRDPNGGLKLLHAVQVIDDAILKTIGDVRLLKRSGVGGSLEDERVRELSERLKQLSALLDAILQDRKNRVINLEPVEVR